MIHRRSEQTRPTWVVLLEAAFVLIAIGIGWQRSVLAEESPGNPPGDQRLPDDLVHIPSAKYASLDDLAPGSREAQERQRQAVEQLGLPLEVKARKTGIVLRLVSEGSFTMGSPSNEDNRGRDETQHQVTLTESFYCGKYEVTQGQWESVMGSNPSYHKDAGRNAPVERVSWEDCQAFLKKLCQIEGVPERTYRLLTEAQWEYACRSGTQTAFCYGNNLDANMANFDESRPYIGGRKDESRQTTVKVGSFRPNGWGLYDMHGNVWEWCQDWHEDYLSGPASDPLGPASGRDCVFRGGCCESGTKFCRSAYRIGGKPDLRIKSLGLRIARIIPAIP